ncbi:hypothetical protein Q5752_001496 [Cryptotrichosporon argae]
MLRVNRPLIVFTAVAAVVLLNYLFAAPGASADDDEHAHRVPSGLHGARAWRAGGAHARQRSGGGLDNDDIDERGWLAWDPRASSHPIERLMARAKQQAAAVDASIGEVESLDDAVEEYERAFKMRPPPGFNKWYDFTRKGDKPLSIPAAPLYSLAHNSILPYLSHPAALLRERVADLREKTDMIFTLTFVPDGQGDKGTACKPGESWSPADEETRGQGRVKIRGSYAWKWRCNNTLSLLLPVLHQLPEELFHLDPPLEMAFSTDDAAHGMSHSSFMDRSVNLAKAGRIWPESQLFAAEQAMRWTYGWSWSCPDGSPLKATANDLVLNDLAEQAAQSTVQTSFIADFNRASDICYNPQNIDMHVSTINQGHVAAVELHPVVATCRTARNSDIVGVPLDAVWDKVSYVPWEQKTRNQIFWRGSTTGSFHSKKLPWRQSQRERLHFFANNNSDAEVDVLVDRNGKLGLEPWSRATLNEAWMDIGLAGQPTQCSRSDGSCDDMAREINFMPPVPKEHAVSFKYVIDVDGNGWSSRFRRLLAGNNVVLKSTQYPEWFNDMMIPWYHYVPVKLDYTDLYDIMAFFSGAPDGSTPGRDDLAKEIAENGYRFVQERWRVQDMQSYTFLLILEWWRALSEDRQKASYQS